MCIYCGTENYRLIYKNHFGPIPTEPDGRKYHIHHIDGNHSNNDPANLKAVTIREHYDIHYSQGDWMACHKLSSILKLSQKEISELASKHAKEQVLHGTHPFLGGSHQRQLAKKLIENGTHNLLGGKLQAETNTKRVADKTHNFLGSRNNQSLLEQGLHISQNKEFQQKFSILQRENMLHRLEQEKWTCEWCGKTGKGKTNYPRHINSKVCENSRKK